MEFINLTPHAIKVRTKSGETKEFEPSGTVARVDVTESPIGDIDGIALSKRTTGSAKGIPEKKEDTIYIVSSMVLAATDRSDVVAPDTGKNAIRDDAGRIQAVTGFVSNNNIKTASSTISSMLDNVSNSLEAKGFLKEAYELDKIADSLEFLD